MSEKTCPIKDVDKLVDILYRLRAMIGATVYLMNLEETYHSLPEQHIETWLHDIGDRLDQAIELL